MTLLKAFDLFFDASATTETYTLSLHDALPISSTVMAQPTQCIPCTWKRFLAITIHPPFEIDRKSTRLNSSHVRISYAVFCLKKKNRSRYLDPHRRLSIFFLRRFQLRGPSIGAD